MHLVDILTSNKQNSLYLDQRLELFLKLYPQAFHAVPVLLMVSCAQCITTLWALYQVFFDNDEGNGDEEGMDKIRTIHQVPCLWGFNHSRILSTFTILWMVMMHIVHIVWNKSPGVASIEGCRQACQEEPCNTLIQFFSHNSIAQSNIVTITVLWHHISPFLL